MARGRVKWRVSREVLVATAVVYAIFWAVLLVAAMMPRSGMDVLKEEVVSAVPVMEIFLNETTLDEVHENGKEVRYTGNRLTLGGVEYDEVEFKGRGNFSWLADKKSYQIKFTEKVGLLGMKKSKKWALVANSVDGTLMRNDLAQRLMGMMLGGNAFYGGFVELIVNGEELGVYYLVRTMDIGKNAVDLRDPMGVLMELDNAYCQEDERRYETTQGNCLTIKDAMDDGNAEKAAVGFVEDFDALERAVSRGDYETVEELADTESLAEYFVISELTSNPDAYVTSWFMYKDGERDKIHFGLAWDFDAAFGNRAWGEWPEGFYAPTTEMARLRYTFEESKTGVCGYDEEALAPNAVKISRMMCQLTEIPEFMETVSDVYRAKIWGRENEIIQYIELRTQSLKLAAERNALVWGKVDFETEVEYLKWWMSERMEFFEETYMKHVGELEVETT